MLAKSLLACALAAGAASAASVKCSGCFAPMSPKTPKCTGVACFSPTIKVGGCWTIPVGTRSVSAVSCDAAGVKFLEYATKDCTGPVNTTATMATGQCANPAPGQAPAGVWAQCECASDADEKAVAVAAPPAPIVVDFSCTKADPIATGLKVDISPNPPVPGQDLTVTIDATLGADLPKLEATVTVDVKVSILPKIDIGPLAVPIATTPYVKKGPISMVVGPISVPTTSLPVKGSLDLTVDVTDGSGTEVACFNVKSSI